MANFTLWERLFGKAQYLSKKTVAVTGASGTMGRALISALTKQGAKPTAITTSPQAQFPEGVTALIWQLGEEADLIAALMEVDILIINHGVNVYGNRTPTAIATSLEVNALSALRLIDGFMNTANAESTTKEIWINTSEAEVGPALSPLYEISKRLLGDLITLKRQDATCIIRKIILGPFKSQLNPVGVMGPDWVARVVVALAKRDVRNIIVTVNPLTYVTFPIKEMAQTLYFKLFSQRSSLGQR